MNTRLHARKTKVVQITGGEAHDFYELHHRQKSNPRIAVRSLGLLYEGEIVAAISFCAPRTSKMKREYSLELYRLCFKSNIRIIGGASKLISYFIKRNKPSDFFTYQDMSGKQSSVYEQSGMRFVSQPKNKYYLVAPEKTLKTAKWGSKEVFTIAEIARRGPDALLGTTLGEVFKKDGKRKTNPEIFTEELGWHIEETPGDRIYEWINSEVTYYTYKITATDSEKYYYGVSHVKRANATFEDCLNDGYMGSGGKKFQNWKERHSGNLEKSIIDVYPKKSSAYLKEEELVGDSYKSDPSCLNSSTGGLKRIAYSTPKISIDIIKCEIHGDVSHRNGVCCKCMVDSRTYLNLCPVHGMSSHQGSSCYKCSTTKSIEQDNCKKHGLTKFNGNSCYKCTVERQTFMDICSIHGETMFRGSTCSKCHANNKNNFKACEIHGLSKHQGDTCYSCMASAMTSFKICEKHGETKFKGNSCYRCTSEKKEATNKIKHVAIEKAKLKENGSIKEANYFKSWSENNVENPASIQAKSSKIFKWWCDFEEEPHEYEKSAYDRARGRDCPKCAKKKGRRKQLLAASSSKT